MDGIASTSETPKYEDVDLDVDRLLKVLPSVATLSVCSAFLKSEGLAHSASDWAELLDKRFREPLRTGQLAVARLADLVHESEENSSKRVHLFQARPGRETHPVFGSRSAEIYADLKGWPPLGQRRIARLPKHPEIVEARHDIGRGQRAFVVKVGTAETRKVVIDRRVDEKGNEVLVIGPRAVPVVNVVRLFEDGLLEIRMHRDKEIHAYGGTANAVWALINPLILRNDYDVRGVHSLLTKIWDPSVRMGLSERIGITKSEHRNGMQTSLEVRAGLEGGDIWSDPDTVETIDRFHNSHGGPAVGCKSAYIVVRARDELPEQERDLIVLLHGQDHEFSVPSKCRKVDYDRALACLIDETAPEKRS